MSLIVVVAVVPLLLYAAARYASYLANAESTRGKNAGVDQAGRDDTGDA